MARQATAMRISARPLVDCAIGTFILAGAALVVVPGVLGLAAVGAAFALNRWVRWGRL